MDIDAELRFRELPESVRRDIARREAARIEREDLKDAMIVLFFLFMCYLVYQNIFYIIIIILLMVLLIFFIGLIIKLLDICKI